MSHKILELLEKDQENISLFKQSKRTLEEMMTVTKSISREFLKILEEGEFPYKNKINNDVYRAGITLALHLPPEDLKIVFTDIENIDASKIEPSDKAYFVDRIRVNAGQKQLYGTNFKKDETGEIIFLPIEDESNVDQKRKEAGLCNLKEYREFIEGKRSSVKAE